MSILTFEFLGFSLALLIAYYALPLKWRPWVLLAFSMAFVAFSGWISLVHLAVLTLIVWGGARGLQSMRERRNDMLACAQKLSGILPAVPQTDKNPVNGEGSSENLSAADDNETKDDDQTAEKQQIILQTENVLKANARRCMTARRWLLALLLFLDLGSMAFIKFYPSAAAALNSGILSGNPLPVWELFVPIGLSYIAFQSAGYLIDVYNGKADAPKNPLRTLLFTGYFLQLPQGPISTWKQLQSQLTAGHRMDPVRFISGFQLMMWGYFKKMVLADRLAPIMAEALKAEDSLTGWLALSAAVLYAVRLYADFSGGMDVVRGLSRMLGIELPENFRRPFFSKSVAEYWRRWHITLGAWFRSCLMYPMTSSRFSIRLGRMAGKIFGKKTGRVLPTALSIILVFFLIGIWHGISMNAVAYGLYFGVLMALSTLLDPLWKRMNKAIRLPGWIMTAFRLIRTWVLIIIPQFFAFAPTTKDAFFMLGRTFSNWSFEAFAECCTNIMLPLEWMITGAALLIVLAVDIICENKKDFCDSIARTRLWIRWPLLALLIMCILVFGCYGTGYDSTAFLYTQF